MDPNRFDALTRTLATALTRRGASRLLLVASAVLAPLVRPALSPADAIAKPNRRRHHGHHHPGDHHQPVSSAKKKKKKNKKKCKPPRQMWQALVDPTAACAGRQCGSVVTCGESLSCGTCAPGQTCSPTGLCTCQANCTGKSCGDDGCGGSCGAAPRPRAAKAASAGVCRVVPAKSAGTMAVGGAVAPARVGASVSANGRCNCVPELHRQRLRRMIAVRHLWQLHRSGECQNGACLCAPDCTNKHCGDDGCGGSCGTCPTGETCAANGQCLCAPDCAGKECGDDGCGGECDCRDRLFFCCGNDRVRSVAWPTSSA